MVPQGLGSVAQSPILACWKKTHGFFPLVGVQKYRGEHSLLHYLFFISGSINHGDGNRNKDRGRVWEGGRGEICVGGGYWDGN